jgi:adenosylcobyric acid synthase
MPIVILLPGSKATIADLAFFRSRAGILDLAAHLRRGGRVIGLCGGYQMLGRAIHDRDGIEGPAGSAGGLGLIDVETVLTADKTLSEAHGRHIATGAEISGYEMHIGRTDGPGRAQPFAEIDGRAEGAVAHHGRVEGSYLHGIFSNDAFRRAWLARIGAAAAGDLAYAGEVDAALDALADHLECHVDIDRLLAIARARPDEGAFRA